MLLYSPMLIICCYPARVYVKAIGGDNFIIFVKKKIKIFFGALTNFGGGVGDGAT